MNFILEKVRVKDVESPFYNKVVDIRVQSGIIEEIAPTISTQTVERFDFQGCDLWPGLCDFRVHFRDPGNEIKEHLESGLAAAIAGGVTSVGILPSTNPSVTSKSVVEYIKQKSDFTPVLTHPYGGVSVDLKGENLAELFDMWNSGAAGFTDDLQTIPSHLLILALEYVQNFDGLIIQCANDKSIFPKGLIHEGLTSTQNGLKGLPSLMEYTTIQQNIALLEYTGGKIHFAGISTKESIDIIRTAKQKGLNITADVNIANLIYTDEDLKDFDANFKVFPPLRSKEDREALVEGLKDGTIDVVCSDHRPEDQESKVVEFENAAFGRTGVQTLFQQFVSLQLDDKILYDVLIKNPRHILKEQCPGVRENQPINAVVFDPNGSIEINEKTQYSLSKNTSLWGHSIKGKVKAVCIDKDFVDLESEE